jgi:hypothetical protein
MVAKSNYDNYSKNLVDKPEETLSFDAINPSDQTGATKFKVEFTPGKWKLKFYEKARDRMKITIKLSKEDAQAWINFSKIMRDDKLTEEDFTKAIFLTGVETINARLAEKLKSLLVENEEELKVNTDPVIHTFEESNTDGEENQTKLL